MWMSDHLGKYEEKFGEIQVGQQKQKSDSDQPSYYG